MDFNPRPSNHCLFQPRGRFADMSISDFINLAAQVKAIAERKK